MPDKSATVQWPGAQAVIEMAHDQSFGGQVWCAGRQHEVEGRSDFPSSEPPHWRPSGLKSGVFLCPEPHQPRDGLHPDSAWDAGLGQHAVLGESPPGHLHPGKGWGSCPRGCPSARLPAPSLTPSPRPQIVLENSSREDKHECPFGRSAIELTKMLCEILQVGELREYAAPLHARSLCSGPVRPKSATLGVSATGQPSWAFFFQSLSGL